MASLPVVARSLAAYGTRRLGLTVRASWTVRGFLLVQVAIFLVAVAIHFGLLPSATVTGPPAPLSR